MNIETHLFGSPEVEAEFQTALERAQKARRKPEPVTASECIQLLAVIVEANKIEANNDWAIAARLVPLEEATIARLAHLLKGDGIPATTKSQEQRAAEAILEGGKLKDAFSEWWNNSAEASVLHRAVQQSRTKSEGDTAYAAFDLALAAWKEGRRATKESAK